MSSYYNNETSNDLTSYCHDALSAVGGDLEIGGMIATGQVAAVFFFTDPLSSHPHQSDVVSLNRICCVHDVMFANNPSSAQSLLFALQFSRFSSSRLVIGRDNDDSHDDHDDDSRQETRSLRRRDSLIVQQYKSNQQKLVAKVVSENENL